jgi:hypothetical protein
MWYGCCNDGPYSRPACSLKDNLEGTPPVAVLQNVGVIELRVVF